MTETLISLDEHNERVRIAREEESKRKVEPSPFEWNDHAQPSGIACPQCGKELIERNEVVGTALMLGQKFLDCPECNFHGIKDGFFSWYTVTP